MKETVIEVGKQILGIFRFIVFIPAGYAAGAILSLPVGLFAKINEIMFGLKMDSWGSHLMQTLIIYTGIFAASGFIKPKSLSPKFFLFAWSIVLTLMATIFMKNVLMPYDPEFPRIKEIINAFAPIVVFISLIIDDQNDVLQLNKP